MTRRPLRSGQPYTSGFEGAHSSVTLFQSASISSAIISGMDVPDPCPISVTVRIVMLPSGAIRTHGDSGAGRVAASAGGRMRVPSVPNAKKNVMPPMPASMPRRVISGDLRAVLMA